MNVVYRVLTWVAIAAGVSLLAPLLLAIPSLLPEWLPYGVRMLILALMFLGLLVYVGGAETRKDVPVEPRGVSRWQSVLLWAAALLAVYPIGRWIGDACPEWLYCGGVRTAYLLMAPLMAIAAGAALFRPFVRHARGTRIAVVGILAGLLLNLATAAIVGDNLAYQGKRLPWGYVMDEEGRERFFPANATDFTIEGWAGFMNVHVVWSCRVDEAGFRAFARQNGYEFRLITTDAEENALGPTGRFGDAKLAKPFYDHANAYDNGGGLLMRYSVPEQKLCGWFVNR